MPHVSYGFGKQTRQFEALTTYDAPFCSEISGQQLHGFAVSKYTFTAVWFVVYFSESYGKKLKERFTFSSTFV